MSITRIQCLSVLLLLSIIGFGPISLTCLIGMGVVIRRPAWFYRLVADLYRDVPVISPPIRRASSPAPALALRARVFTALSALLILDIAPIPVTGLIGLAIVIGRPRWFLNLTEALYGWPLP